MSREFWKRREVIKLLAFGSGILGLLYFTGEANAASALPSLDFSTLSPDKLQELFGAPAATQDREVAPERELEIRHLVENYLNAHPDALHQYIHAVCKFPQSPTEQKQTETWLKGLLSQLAYAVIHKTTRSAPVSGSEDMLYRSYAQNRENRLFPSEQKVIIQSLNRWLSETLQRQANQLDTAYPDVQTGGVYSPDVNNDEEMVNLLGGESHRVVQKPQMQSSLNVEPFLVSTPEGNVFPYQPNLMNTEGQMIFTADATRDSVTKNMNRYIREGVALLTPEAFLPVGEGTPEYTQARKKLLTILNIFKQEKVKSVEVQFHSSVVSSAENSRAVSLVVYFWNTDYKLQVVLPAHPETQGEAPANMMIFSSNSEQFTRYAVNVATQEKSAPSVDNPWLQAAGIVVNELQNIYAPLNTQQKISRGMRNFFAAAG